MFEYPTDVLCLAKVFATLIRAIYRRSVGDNLSCGNSILPGHITLDLTRLCSLLHQAEALRQADRLEPRQHSRDHETHDGPSGRDDQKHEKPDGVLRHHSLRKHQHLVVADAKVTRSAGQEEGKEKVSSR